jgi:hypothetical protein
MTGFLARIKSGKCETANHHKMRITQLSIIAIAS